MYEKQSEEEFDGRTDRSDSILYLFIYSFIVISVLSFCAALWKPCVCLNSCYINKVDWMFTDKSEFQFRFLKPYKNINPGAVESLYRKRYVQIPHRC